MSASPSAGRPDGTRAPRPLPDRVAVLAGGLIGSAALIAVITVVSRVAGFGRWVVFAPSVGANCVGEAYATANQMPNVLFEVVAGGALAGAVVPLLAGPFARAAAGSDDVDRIASALVTWIFVALVPLAVVLALLAGPITSVMLDAGSCPGQAAFASHLLTVFAPQVVLYGLGVVLTGVLQAQRRFFWPALAPLLSSLVVIVSYLAFRATANGHQDDPTALSGTATAWLGWGTTAGVAAMTLPLLWPVWRSGVRLRPRLRFPSGIARRAVALSSAGILVLLAQQASVLVIFRLANGDGRTGAVNVYQYTQAVYLLPYAVLAVPLATAAFPRLAAAVAAGDRVSFARVASGSTRLVLVAAGVGASLLVAGAPAVAAFFDAIDTGSGETGMAGALTAMAPGLIGFALIAHVGRALYALDRAAVGATAQVVGWLGVAVMALVGVQLAPATSDTVVALALAGTLGMTVSGFLLLQGLRESAGPEALAGLLRTAAALTLGAVLGVPAGRTVADTLLRLGGTAAPSAVVAALGSAVVVVVVVGGVTAVIERRDVALLRSRGA